MAGETEDPDDAAARLEAALERIAQYAGAHAGAHHAGTDSAGAPSPAADVSGDPSADMTDPAPPVEEIAARLDGLIDRLRAALATSPVAGRFDSRREG